MPELMSSNSEYEASGGRVLELRVRNHPGAMSHITGLFARRAFNLEAILCLPNADDDGATSTILLSVPEEPRLDQVQQQLRRLHDVLAVECRAGPGPELFHALLARTVRKAR